MKCGEVYYWTSDQAKGHDVRDKYHVYIGEGDWRHQGHVFLFINKSNAHGNGYEITKPPYDFLKLLRSYVSCGDHAEYGDDVVPPKIGPCLGRLGPAHRAELRRTVDASDVMATYTQELVCAALDAAAPLRRPKTG